MCVCKHMQARASTNGPCLHLRATPSPLPSPVPGVRLIHFSSWRVYVYVRGEEKHKGERLSNGRPSEVFSWKLEGAMMEMEAAFWESEGALREPIWLVLLTS